MGTDVYLKEEKYEEELGYVRASIWMREENAVLRQIFDERYWGGGGYIEYDFDQNVELFKRVAKQYSEGEIRVGNSTEMEKVMQAIDGALQRKGFESVKGEINSDEERTEWLKNLVKFFKTGWELQKKGKKPKIYISW